jgi:hypothetical protein
MRSHLLVLALSTLGMVIGGCGRVRGNEGAKTMTAYYVEIGAETLTPVTSANIEERGRHCEIRSSGEIGKIERVLQGAAKPTSQKFSDMRVRVKLLEASSKEDRLVAIVENDGEVRFSDGTEGQISRSDLDTIKEVIERQCREVSPQ